MGWLKAIKRWFTGRAADDAARAVEIARQALPIVEMVAKLTPTRADDEILRLFTLFGLPAVDSFLALPVEARGRALMHAAATQLARIVPGVPGRVLDLAVQMAVVELRGAGAAAPVPAPAGAAAPVPAPAGAAAPVPAPAGAAAPVPAPAPAPAAAPAAEVAE